MTEWTDLTDTGLIPGAPALATQGLALRDNPIAIAEGAAGAPGINFRALEQLEAGDVLRLGRDDGHVISAVSPAQALFRDDAFYFLQRGTVRLTYEAAVEGGGTSYVRLNRHGASSTLTSFSEGGSYTARYYDIDVLPGDFITLEVSSPGSGFDCLIRNAGYRTAGQNIWRVSGAYLPMQDHNAYT